jgi:7-cyano-7-deazaguanine synthase
LGKKVVIILSGGMDSATLLYDLLNSQCDVWAVSFDYGQRHILEIGMAKMLCRKAGVPHKIIDLHVLGDVAPSSQTREHIAVPHGRYDEENMKATVVPNRNMVMLSLAVSYAIGIGATKVFYGAHAGDHAIYPDCRVEFIDALNKAVELCDWNEIHIQAPYMNMTKGEIAKRGLHLGVPFECTLSCYEGTWPPCGQCGACTERAEAFEFAGQKDPLLSAINIPALKGE